MKTDIDVYKDQTFLLFLFFLKDEIKLDWQTLRRVSVCFSFNHGGKYQKILI